MATGTRRGYWTWRTPHGWDLLVHWSCAPAAAAVAAVTGIQIAGDYPALTLTSRWFFAALSGVLVSGAVAIHELGHLLMARRLGLEAAGVILRGFSGATVLPRHAPTPAKEALFAVAGPAASLFVAALAGGVGLLMLPGPLATIASGTGFLNLMVALATVLPAWPLDGGLVVRAWRWHVTGDRDRATRDSRRIGQVSGVLLLMLGLLAIHTRMGGFVVAAGVATLAGPATARYARHEVTKPC